MTGKTIRLKFLLIYSVIPRSPLLVSLDLSMPAMVCIGLKSPRKKESRQLFNSELIESDCSQIFFRYASQMKMPEFLEAIHYEEQLWMNEEWSKGCYVGYMGPGVLTTCGRGIREPIGRIYFAGCEAASVWTGYMVTFYKGIGE